MKRKSWITTMFGLILIAMYIRYLIIAPYGWDINLPVLFVGIALLFAKDFNVREDINPPADTTRKYTSGKPF